MTLQEVDSTNVYAKNLLQSDPKLIEGTVVQAWEQTAGKGQYNNKWESEAGKNLTFSLILHPSFLRVCDQFWLNRVVCLGVVKALSVYADGMKIKWPNDIYYQEKKLGGILIENILQGDSIRSAVVGLGLNVNQTRFSDKLPNAISLKSIIHRELNVMDVLGRICENIEPFYLKLKSNNWNEIEKIYLEHLLGLHQERQFMLEGNLVSGEIQGVTSSGKLIVRMNDTSREFDLKEISFILE